MVNCGYCEKKTKINCPSCNIPMCEDHQFSDPWRNIFRQGIICEKCYKKRIMMKNSFIIPFILIAAVGIANAVDLRIGLKELSMWQFINAFAIMTSAITMMTFIYGIISKKRDVKLWGISSLISGIILGISYLVINLLA